MGLGEQEKGGIIVFISGEQGNKVKELHAIRGYFGPL